jgi:N-acetylneuraminate synthase/sialic acid synthase
MLKFKNLFDNRNIKTSESFIIAEVGHNHKGSVEIAKKLFLSAKECGADAIKLQKRDNLNLYTKDFYNRIYQSENSYGKTYGLHRENLEFGKKDYKELINYAKKIDIEFLCTPFDFESLIFLEALNIKAYKIASADLVNLPLQQAIAKTKKPIFLSTGGGNFTDIDRAVKNISKINKKFSILHCTAAYPVELKDMHLNVIKVLKKKYPNNPIGLSDHENGIDAAPLGYMLGARIFEKHFTLDRSWKGTDHAFSLEPEGLRKLIRNLRRVPLILGSKNKKILSSEKIPLQKMFKSIVASRDLKKDTILKYADISFKSPGGGLKPYEYKKILNKKTKIEIKKDQLILLKKLK